MGCSRLFGSVILSFFLFTSLVANTQTKDVKLGVDSQNTVKGEDFDATLYQVKNSDDVIKPGDANHPKNVGLYNKSAAKNPASVSNTLKNPNDVVKAKNTSDVIKKGDQSRLDLTPQDKGITNGAEKTKQGEVLRKEGNVVSKIRSSNSSSLGIEGGVIKTKEGEVLRKEGTIYNKNTQHSTFKINTRIDNVIQTEGRPDCPAGTVPDCSGDGDCAPESWIGDGWCDGTDQPYGYDLTCYGNDGGDCADEGTTTTSGGGANLIASYDISYDWYCTGSYGTGVVNFYDDYSADLSGTPGTWGFNAPMTMDAGLCAEGTLGEGYFFEFDNYASSYNWDQSGCGYHDDWGYNGQGNVDGVTLLLNYADVAACYGDDTTTTTTSGGAECPAGTVDDCSGDGDCCPESWIGDGFEDCEDQAFGCDLTCYGEDGGDCANGTTTTTTTTTTTSGGNTCPDGTVEDCSGDGDCCPLSWIGDGFEDCEDQAFGCDLTCYDNDGGDCGGGTSTTGGGDLIWSAPMTYDWGCYGYYGTGTVNFYADGTADIDGAPGTWFPNSDTYNMPTGFCEGVTITPSVIFVFNGYSTSFAWATGGNGYPSDPGCGIMDDFGYNGQNVDGTTSLNMEDPSMCYDNSTTTTTSGGGECPEGTVEDCVDEDCCPESWIGDGFEDCEDQAFGCDLTCYDNDGGDCGDGTTTTTTTTTSGGGCPDGTVDDCSGDGDCCPESWIADGFEDCEDQAFGCDLTCYDNDGGDCDPGDDCEANGQVACHDGACADTFEDCFALLGDPVRSELISYDWGCTGSPGETIMDVFGVVWNDGSNTQLGFVYGDNLWVHIWNDWSGSEVTIPAGEYCPEWTANSDWGFYFDAAPWVNYGYACEDESNESCEGVHSFDGWTTVGGWTTSLKLNPDECPDGFVDDCADGDCCPESWIGDGFEDCEDQAFGCDLTCYDNDGGDCGGGTTTTTTTTTSGGGECPEGTVQDCVDDDCCPESWIGDGFEDCEDQAFGCDLTCYDNDGGDCGGGTTTTTGGTACDEVIWSSTMTYDWYCTGSYGEAAIDFCANGVADLSGNPGTWTSGNETTLVADGLCPLGGEFNNNLSYMFDNYATVYNWDTEGDDIYTPGTGYHDDMGYNGEGNWDGLSCINGGDCSVDTSTTTTTSGGGECPAGTVQDCVDDDCCPESWIGDGFEDCEDQAFGCDLTCYDNDGGDCGGGTTTTTSGGTTTTGGNCPVGTVPDCSGDGDCCPESWIGDGFEDCEDQQFGCDLTCYNNDGNDCGDGPDPNDDLWNWYDFVTCTDGNNECIGTYEFTLDWNCDEFDIQSAPVTFLYDCTDPNSECNGGAALLFGYEGFWSANPDGGILTFSDGACEGETLDWDMFFALPDFGFAAGYDMDGLGTDAIAGDGLMDDVFYNGNFNKDGNSSIVRTDTVDVGCLDGTVEDCSGDGDCCPVSWIGDGFEDCEDQAFGCDLTCYDNDGGDCDGGPDCAAGDVNCDGSIDVVDVVNMVNAIINGDVLEGGDVNGDGSLDVVDVVLLVNYIIDGGARAMDADSATITIADNSLKLSADGYIGGIQMTLTHGNGFEINLTDNAMVSEYKTTGTSTTLVVVVPEEELIFTANQSFEVVNMIVANSEVEIDVNTVSEFGITAAYPNPFNPSTTVSLNVPSADFVSVKVYNLVGQVVGVLAEGMMDANTYTFTWNATDMSSGVYMIRAESGSKVDIQKVLLVK